MAKISKQLRAKHAEIDTAKSYPLREAVELAQKASVSKFDGSIDVAVKLNLDTTKVEQQLRGTIVLPHNNGKKVRILVIDDTVSDAQAKEAGAQYHANSLADINIEEMIPNLDLIITTPKVMPQLSKLGKILGPRGLMPNPKVGTVTPTTLKTVEEFSRGRIEYRTDSYGNVHLSVGRVSFDPDQIVDNINALLNLLRSRRPTTVKGVYIENVSVSPTMGLGIKVQPTNL